MLVCVLFRFEPSFVISTYNVYYLKYVIILLHHIYFYIINLSQSWLAYKMAFNDFLCYNALFDIGYVVHYLFRGYIYIFHFYIL